MRCGLWDTVCYKYNKEDSYKTSVFLITEKRFPTCSCVVMKENITVGNERKERGTVNCKWELIVLLAKSDANQIPS